MSHVTTGIEFLPSRIRIVQLKSNAAHLNVMHWGEIALQQGDPNDEQSAAVLREYLARHALKCTRAIIGLPRHEITVRSLTVPTTDADEIRSMLSFEVAKLVPFNSDDLIHDYRVLKTDEKGYSHLQVVVAQRSRIQRYVNLCRAAGFEPFDFQIRIAALANLIIFGNTQPPHNQESAPRDFTPVSLEEDMLEVARIEDNHLIFSRGVSFPAKNLDLLIAELTKTSEFYKKESNKSLFINPVIAGDPNLFSATEEKLRPIVDSPSLLSPSDVLKIKPLNTRENSAHLDFDSRFAVASGLALHDLSPRSLRFDLLPAELKEHKARKALSHSALVVLALFTIVLILLYANIDAFFLIKKHRINRLQKEITALRPVGNEIKKMRDKITVIRDQMDMRNSPLDILCEIVKITPPDISLNSLHLDFAGRVTLGGEATEFSKPYTYVSILENSKRFKNAATQYVTRKRIGDQETIVFKISCDVDQLPEETVQ